MSPDLATDVLRDAFGRVREEVSGVLSGLGPDEVLWRPDPEANSIGWLVWHLARIQDDHLAGVGQVEQVWTGGGWYERFGLPYPRQDHGYGHSPADVGRFVVADPALLEGYHAAVHTMTLEVLDGMGEADYARIVDRRWDPPVTAAVRLVSVVSDTLQHVGQAAYVRGLRERSTRGA
jgi:hypothetical protein